MSALDSQLALHRKLERLANPPALKELRRATALMDSTWQLPGRHASVMRQAQEALHYSPAMQLEETLRMRQEDLRAASKISVATVSAMKMSEVKRAVDSRLAMRSQLEGLTTSSTLEQLRRAAAFVDPLPELSARHSSTIRQAQEALRHTPRLLKEQTMRKIEESALVTRSFSQTAASVVKMSRLINEPIGIHKAISEFEAASASTSRIRLLAERLSANAICSTKHLAAIEHQARDVQAQRFRLDTLAGNSIALESRRIVDSIKRSQRFLDGGRLLAKLHEPSIQRRDPFNVISSDISIRLSARMPQTRDLHATINRAAMTSTLNALRATHIGKPSPVWEPAKSRPARRNPVPVDETGEAALVLQALQQDYQKLLAEFEFVPRKKVYMQAVLPNGDKLFIRRASNIGEDAVKLESMDLVTGKTRTVYCGLATVVLEATVVDTGPQPPRLTLIVCKTKAEELHDDDEGK